MREIVTAASAAGVAVAFGSPIGGVLFSLEVCVNDHNLMNSLPMNLLLSDTGNDHQLPNQDDDEKFLLRLSSYCDTFCMSPPFALHLSPP